MPDTTSLHENRIYSAEWRAWRDPEIPDWIDPIELLIGRHLTGATAKKAAVVIDGQATSYAELNDVIKCTSGGLSRIGLQAEQRILLFGTDSLEYITTWLASIHAGLVPAVVSDLYKANDLLYFLTDTAAAALYIDVEQLGKLQEILPQIPKSLRHVIVRGGGAEAIEGQFGSCSVVPFSELVRGPSPSEAHLRHANDVTYMFYSGGTTGAAKGITHLAHDFLLVPERQGTYWEYSASDVVFATSKKYFTHGLWPGLLIPLYRGATAILTRDSVKPDLLLDIIERYSVTKLITVPTILRNLVDHVSSTADFVPTKSLALVISASEKIPPHLFEAFFDRFGIEILDSIGSSEVTYEWIANRASDFKRGSLGRPIFGYEIKLMSPDAQEITEPNVPGEAWVRSKTACFFYWRKYDKSRETFIGDWMRSGDNLYFDEEGYFWFSGRENDVFKVSGLWISPLEIEAALMRHPSVKEAAVVSFDADGGLVRPKAFVVLREGVKASPELEGQLSANVRPLGGYKVPAAFEYISELPRTTLLKVDRKALRVR